MHISLSIRVCVYVHIYIHIQLFVGAGCTGGGNLGTRILPLFRSMRMCFLASELMRRFVLGYAARIKLHLKPKP